MNTERGILFSAPMVRAILEGRKTVTRRLVKPQPPAGTERFATVALCPPTPTKVVDWLPVVDGATDYGAAPLRQIATRGDRLWVQETWGSADHYYQDHENDDPSVVAYAADRSAIQFHAKTPRPIPSWDVAQWNWDQMKWKPSIFMPRWASRITLDVVDVRVERLHEISAEDALAEGLSKLSKDGGQVWKHGIPDRDRLPGNDDDGWPWSDWNQDPRQAFATLWDRINGKRAPWASNPWVWRVEFKRAAQ